MRFIPIFVELAGLSLILFLIINGVLSLLRRRQDHSDRPFSGKRGIEKRWEENENVITPLKDLED